MPLSIRWRMVLEMTKQQLSIEDWLKASFRALTAGGPQAIRAEAIARDLKVSKGSFYWHFKDVPALKAAMLDHWHAAATQAVISVLEREGGTPQDRLHALIMIATGPSNEPYGGRLTEAAIRDWARFDETAATIVKQVERTRLDYLERLFTQCGCSTKVAKTRAGILYGALIGLETLAHNELADLQADMEALLTLLTRDAAL